MTSMPRRKGGIFWPDIYKAVFERKTSQGRINKIVDSVAEEDFIKDELLHFANEVVLHRHPRQHVANTIKYGIKPRLRRLLKI